MNRVLAMIVNGVVANVFLGAAEMFPDAVDVTDITPRPGPGWTYDGSDFTPGAAGAAEPRHVTRLAFRNRFTTPELVALEIASLDNPAATIPTRQQAAGIRVMMANLATAAFIDLQRADTRAGVQQLEAGGLIGVGRAVQIIDNPIQPEELPPGL